MISDDLMDETLRSLAKGGDGAAPPPPGPDLEAALASMQPVHPRRPRRDLAVVVVVSLVVAAALLAKVALRPDLGELPLAWAIGCGAAWLASFAALSWFALVPPQAEVMPAPRRAGVGAVVAAVVFVGLGFAVVVETPGSVHLAPGLAGLIAGRSCLEIGLACALAPVALSVLLMRGTVATGGRAIGAAVGAAGGSLGGLVLHLHCPVADRLHLAVMHGGVVVVAAIVGALVVPPLTRP